MLSLWRLMCMIKQADMLAANKSKYSAVESAKSVVKWAKASSKKYLAGNAQLLARPFFQWGTRWAQDILSVRYWMGLARHWSLQGGWVKPTPHCFQKGLTIRACSQQWGATEENRTPLSQRCALKSARLSVSFTFNTAAPQASWSRSHLFHCLLVCHIPGDVLAQTLCSYSRVPQGTDLQKNMQYFSGVPNHFTQFMP